MTAACQQYIRSLYAHDWYYEMSDDGRVYIKKCAEHERLKGYADSIPEFRPFFYHALDCARRQQRIQFPAAMLESANPNTNTQDNTIMKEVLALILATLIQPLIDSIDRLTAATKGTGYAPSAPAPTTEPPVIETAVEAPAVTTTEKKTRGSKATKTEPEPAAGDAEEDISPEDLKALADTIPPGEGRDKFKAGIKKNLGLNSIKEADTPALRLKCKEGLIKCGAKLPEPAPAEEGW